MSVREAQPSQRPTMSRGHVTSWMGRLRKHLQDFSAHGNLLPCLCYHAPLLSCRPSVCPSLSALTFDVPQRPAQKLLFDFRTPADLQPWQIVSDQDYKGSSWGQLQLTGDQHGTFAGHISLAVQPPVQPKGQKRPAKQASSQPVTSPHKHQQKQTSAHDSNGAGPGG